MLEAPPPAFLDEREAKRRHLLQIPRPSSQSSLCSTNSNETNFSLPSASPWNSRIAGLEVCQDEYQGLEPFTPESYKKEVDNSTDEKIVRYGHWDDKEVYAPASSGKHHRGFPRRTCYILLAILFIAIIALGIGLGVAFGLKSHANSQSSTETAHEIGGTIDPAYYSRKGAFNGTGIFAVAGVSSPDAKDYTMDVIYQGYNGQFRWVNFSLSADTLAPTLQSTIQAGLPIAKDAKNSTPISIVSYIRNGTLINNLFYLDTDSFARHLVWSNLTAEWLPGSFNALNVKALNADLVEMRGYYNYDTTDAEQGMNLWVAVGETTFKQYLYTDSEDKWTERRTWDNFSGHSGITFAALEAATNITHVMLENPYNSAEIWWKDNSQANPTWQNASNAAIPDIYPSSPLVYPSSYGQSFPHLFFAQSAHSPYTILPYNITLAGSATIVEPAIITQGQEQPTAIPGSRVQGIYFERRDGRQTILLVYQADGDDITLARLDAVDANGTSTLAEHSMAWNITRLDIPDY